MFIEEINFYYQGIKLWCSSNKLGFFILITTANETM